MIAIIWGVMAMTKLSSLLYSRRTTGRIKYVAMPVLLGLLVVLFVSVLPSHSTVQAGDDAPAWLKQAAALTPPTYEKDVPGVVLWNDSHLSVDEDGRVVETTDYAIKILTREGRALARAVAGYETDSGKVKEIRAWLIRPSGEVKKYSKDE